MQASQVESMDARLISAIGDLRERVHNLRLFDPQSEVNAHCDDLESSVLLTTESVLNSVAKIRDDLLAKISEYRKSLIDTSHTEIDEPDLARLAEDVDAFSSKCMAQQVDLAASLSEAQRLTLKAKEVRGKQRCRTFQGQFLKFFESELLGSNFIGQLNLCGQDTEEEADIRSVCLDECQYKVYELTPQSQYKGKHVLSVAFLSDDNLAIGLTDSPILIWSPRTEQTLFQLDLIDSLNETLQIDVGISALAQLTNGNLASGDFKGHIDIWNLETRRHVRRIKLREYPVKFSKALPDGMLFVSTHDQNEILKPDDEYPLKSVFSIYVHSHSPNQIEGLHDGSLVAFGLKGFRAKENEYAASHFGFWSFETGYRKSKFHHPPFQMGKITKNGDIFMCFKDRSVQVFNVLSKTLCRIFQHLNEPLRDIVQRSDGSIAFLHYKKSAPIGDAKNGDLMDSKFCSSSNDKCTVIGHQDGRFVLFAFRKQGLESSSINQQTPELFN